MNKKKIKIFLNFAIIIFEIIGFTLAIDNFGYRFIEYYTQDSNLMVLATSILYLIYTINDKKIPALIQWLKYTSVVSITITFVVVVTILSWTMEGGIIAMLFKNSMLFHHTICPLLTIISFIFFEDYDFRSYKDTFRTVYFTIIYAIILIILNILRIVEGPYPFLMVYNQSIFMSILWFVLIIGGTFVIAALLKNINKKFNK